MANITTQDNEMAEAFGISAEDVAAAREQTELAPGTYDFQIAGGKVEVVTKADSKIKDAIQFNLQLRVKASDNSVARRYQTVFKRINVPMENGSFKPQGTILQLGTADMKWLAEQTGVSLADLAKGAKSRQLPAGLLTKTVRGRYSLRPNENDPTRPWADVKPAKPSDKVTPITPDGKKADAGASTGASADDNAPPF